MERHLDAELTRLKEQLLTMAGLAEQSVGKSVKALVDRDSKMAQAVMQATSCHPSSVKYRISEALQELHDALDSLRVRRVG